MRRAAAFLLAALLPAASFAEETTEHGEVTAIDRVSRSFTIERIEGEPETFTVGESVAVEGEGAEDGFDALAVGQKVAVEAEPDASGRQRAHRVRIVQSEEIAGQVEDRPAFDAADTATVVSVDDDQNRLRVESTDGPALYRVTEDTRIQRGGEEIELRELVKGDRVAISAEETTPGDFTARSVTVVSGSAPGGG